NLRRADQERGLDAGCGCWKALVETLVEQMAQRAEAAQGRRHDVAHQRTVAFGERAEPGWGLGAVEQFIERASAAQNALQNLGGDAPRWQAWRFRWCRSVGH